MFAAPTFLFSPLHHEIDCTSPRIAGLECLITFPNPHTSSVRWSRFPLSSSGPAVSEILNDTSPIVRRIYLKQEQGRQIETRLELLQSKLTTRDLQYKYRCGVGTSPSTIQWPQDGDVFILRDTGRPRNHQQQYVLL